MHPYKLFAAYAILIASSFAHADGAKELIQNITEQTKSSIESTIILTDSNLKAVFVEDESNLKDATCTYITSDIIEIDRIAKIIENAEIQNANELALVLPYNGIYFNTKDGKKIGYIFGQIHESNLNTFGYITNGIDSPKVFIKMNRTFPKDFFNMVISFNKKNENAEHCNSLVANFIK